MYAYPESVPICPFVWRVPVLLVLRQVLSDMFKCWRDAFEDFMPGLKAEWKAVFKNKVCVLVGACWRVSSFSTAGQSILTASRSVCQILQLRPLTATATAQLNLEQLLPRLHATRTRRLLHQFPKPHRWQSRSTRRTRTGPR